MRLTIIGPNLSDQSKGNIHVHKEGCSDIHKRVYALPLADGEFDTDEYASQREVVESVYPVDSFEWSDGPDDRSYWSDVYFLPCTKGLPRETPE
jgi:hypothetical protein